MFLAPPADISSDEGPTRLPDMRARARARRMKTHFAAVAQGRELVTRDGDFAAFHFAGLSHFGIVILQRDYRVGDMTEALATVLDASNA
jgi:hypothetical protein